MHVCKPQQARVAYTLLAIFIVIIVIIVLLFIATYSKSDQLGF
jgi:competence protein ComGC